MGDSRGLATVSRALGDDTRLEILRLLLKRGETCVCELMDTMEMTQSNVSFHLAVLKNAGLIADKKIGKWIFYSLNLKAVEQHCTRLKKVFSKKRLGAERPATSVFTVCAREQFVPLGRRQVRQKVAQLRARDKVSAGLRAAGGDRRNS